MLKLSSVRGLKKLTFDYQSKNFFSFKMSTQEFLVKQIF